MLVLGLVVAVFVVGYFMGHASAAHKAVDALEDAERRGLLTWKGEGR